MWGGGSNCSAKKSKVDLKKGDKTFHEGGCDFQNRFNEIKVTPISIGFQTLFSNC